MEKDKTTTFGRDYFLESLPVEWDEMLDGPREASRKTTKRKGDVVVHTSELQRLKDLGLIK